MTSKSDLGKSCPTKYSDVRQQCKRYVGILQQSQPCLCMELTLTELFWADGRNDGDRETCAPHLLLHSTETQFCGSSPHTAGITGFIGSEDGRVGARHCAAVWISWLLLCSLIRQDQKHRRRCFSLMTTREAYMENLSCLKVRHPESNGEISWLDTYAW